MSASALTEAAFQTRITDFCERVRLKWFHDNDPLRNNPGWLDLTIGGPGGVLFRELKTDTGRLTTDQKDWLHLLQAAGYDAGVWRPRDWEHVVLPELNALRWPRRGAM